MGQALKRMVRGGRGRLANPWRSALVLLLCSCLFCPGPFTPSPVSAQTANIAESAPGSGQLSRMSSVYVRNITVEGNTVIPADELAAIVSSYENRGISSEELHQLRRELTSHYVEKGYVNSGVIIPDQQVRGGEIVLRAIEGKLVDIEITGSKHLRESYIRKRLQLAAGGVLNINRLQQQLLVLQNHPMIKRLSVDLKPGAAAGEAILVLNVEENRPYNAGIELSNTRSPSIGGELLQFQLMHLSVLGYGDAAVAKVGLTEGNFEYDLSYTIPINVYDTLLKFQVRRNQTVITEEPFQDLNIEADTQTYGITVSHPFFRFQGTEFWMGLTGEHRTSESSLLGVPFPFDPGLDSGEAKVTALRWFQELVRRDQNQVAAIRSTLSFGVDAMDATIGTGGPDGRFFSWLGQFHWIRKLGRPDWQIAFRTDAQISNDPLLSFEKFSIGGMDSVRGYRENRLVRDNGVASALELRVPVYWNAKEEAIVHLVPFLDFGASWNTGSDTPDPTTIASAGLGLRWAITEKINFQIYGGFPFRRFHETDRNIQDAGVHVRMVGYLF